MKTAPHFALKCARNRHLKRAAEALLGLATRAGEIVAEPCVGCGDDAEPHHEDYGEPLALVWYCRACHFQRHAEIQRENAARLGVPSTREWVRGTVEPYYMEIPLPWGRGMPRSGTDPRARILALIAEWRDRPFADYRHLTSFDEGVARVRRLEADHREYDRWLMDTYGKQARRWGPRAIPKAARS